MPHSYRVCLFLSKFIMLHFLGPNHSPKYKNQNRNVYIEGLFLKFKNLHAELFYPYIKISSKFWTKCVPLKFPNKFLYSLKYITQHHKMYYFYLPIVNKQLNFIHPYRESKIVSHKKVEISKKSAKVNKILAHKYQRHGWYWRVAGYPIANFTYGMLIFAY